MLSEVSALWYLILRFMHSYEPNGLYLWEGNSGDFEIKRQVHYSTNLSILVQA